MGKKIKTKEEWKDKVLMNLSPQDFQDLCFDLLRSNKFDNPSPRGGGADGGRDIEAEFNFPFGKKIVRQKCWFQCKRYGSTPLNYKEFNSELQKADNRGIDRFVVVSNKDMTSDTKSEIEEWNKKHKCQVDDWTGTLFLDVLFESPNICRIYFPDEEIPNIVSENDPKEIIPLSKNLGNRFGIEIEIDGKGIDINNPLDISKRLKETLLKLEINPNLKALIYEKSSLFFFSLNQKDDALFFLNKSLDITNKNIGALLIKGYVLKELDDIEESNKIYDEILEMDKDNLIALNNKSENLKHQGELHKSMELVEKILKINASFIPAIKNKISLLKNLKEYKLAREFLSDSEKLFDKSIDLMIEKVDLLIEELDLRSAFDLNEEILKKESDNIIALNNKGVIYERNARFDKHEKYLPLAIESFNKAIEKDEKFMLGWANKTLTLMNKVDLSEAEEIIDSAYTKFPDSPEVLNARGALFLKKNEVKKATKYFRSSLKKSYKGQVLLNLAMAEVRLRHYKEALNHLEKLLKNEKENSLAWKLKGTCLKALRRAKSKICFDNAEKFKLTPLSLLD